MSAVYRNATITLSADGADDASGGLFGSPSTRTLAHELYSISTEGLDGEPVMVHARRRSKRPSNPDTSPHSSVRTEPSKLSSRSWVVQERILSPRMVHFHKEELVWSCYGQQRCECRLMSGASSSGIFRRLLTSSKTEWDLIHEWPKLVSQFTTKDLTYAKDRLPAISGLATLMGQHISMITSTYLAGIWSCDMEYSLLWVSDHDRAKDTPIQRMPIETDKTYAPSWSWASIIGPVRYIHRHLDQLSNRRSGEDEIDPIFRAVKAAAIPATSNPYGPVKYGFVTIQGQILPVEYDIASSVWRPSSRQWDDWSDFGISDAPGGSTQPARAKTKFIFDVLNDSPEDNVFATRNFVLLRAATYIWGGVWSTPSTEVVALILIQVSINPVAYRRIGIALHAFNGKTVWEDVPIQSVVLT